MRVLRAAIPFAATARRGPSPAPACLFLSRGRLGAALLAASTLLSGPVFAQPAPTVAIQAPWARATTPGVTTGGVYFTLTSPAGDRLVGATSPLAAKAMVHQMSMDGTIMRMRAVDGLDLPPGQAVALSPSGYHLMLEGLRSPMRQGTTVPVHLVFQNAPPVDIAAPVQSIGSRGPGAAHGGMPSMVMPK